jgi:hypothetical protein
MVGLAHLQRISSTAISPCDVMFFSSPRIDILWLVLPCSIMNQLLVPDAQDMNSKSGFALSICHLHDELDLLSRIHLLQNHITKHAKV